VARQVHLDFLVLATFHEPRDADMHQYVEGDCRSRSDDALQLLTGMEPGVRGPDGIDRKALGREVAVQNGDFVVASIPAGTWVAEARVIGVEPQDVLVTASDSVVTTATITVSNSPQRLDAVTVVGKMDRNLRVLDEVLRRKRLGTGTTFLPGHPALKSAHFVADVMKEARGFRYLARDEVMTYQGCKYVAVYVDGDPLPDGFERVDHLVAMKDVLAIETWASRGHAPVMFQYGFGYSDPRKPHVRFAPCAVVAVWTHRRF